ncbi:MAG: transcriptional repressor [Nitrososphaeria archaeon]
MHITDLGNAIRSNTRIRILKIINDKHLRAIDVYKEIVKFQKIHRESVYKELELLVKYGLLDKKYDATKKAIVYTLKIRAVNIDLAKGEIMVK